MTHGKLSNRVAIVTGASKGIGRAISIAYANEGAKVIAMSRNLPDLESLQREIESSGGAALTVVGDVSSAADALRAVSAGLEKFRRIDILVNNAGICGTTKDLEGITDGEWDDVMATNVRGVFIMTREVLPQMLPRRAGNIINITSGAGQKKPRSFVRSIPYAVSKFAVEGFTDALAVRLREARINVNALSPGPTRTSMQNSWSASDSEIHARELGELHEVGFANNLAVYLAALSPGELTGQSISAVTWNKVHQ